MAGSGIYPPQVVEVSRSPASSTLDPDGDPVEVPRIWKTKLCNLKTAGESPNSWWPQPVNCRHWNKLKKLLLILFLEAYTTCVVAAGVTLNSRMVRRRVVLPRSEMVPWNSQNQKTGRYWKASARSQPAFLVALTSYNWHFFLKISYWECYFGDLRTFSWVGMELVQLPPSPPSVFPFREALG